MKRYTDRELDLSNQVLSFLKQHPLISVNGLNDLLGLPSSTLQKSIASEKIPPKHLYSVIYELAKYGLQIDGYTLEADPNSPLITMFKNVGDAKVKEVKTKSGSYFEYVQKQYRSMASDLLDFID